MASLIIDLVAIVLIVVTVTVSAKKGFLAEIVSFIGWLVSAFVANFLCKIIADYLYTNIIKEKILSSVIAAMDGHAASLSSSYADFFGSLPEWIQRLLGNADLSGLNSIFEDPSRTVESVASQLCEEFIGPVVMTLLTALSFIVVFLICLFIVKLLARLFKGVRRIPIIGPVNTFLGGLIGVAEAVIILYFIKMVVEFILTSAGGSIPYVTLEDFANSYIFKTLNFNFRGLL